ncbi:MAG: BlaI/MecI/CopY family transcriptional regulator [bacterium]
MERLFTPGELEVMQVLWEHGALKPVEIQKRFSRPIRNAALRSVLLILLEKGHVTRTKDGKAYYYKAKTRRERGLKQMMRNVADVFCGGSSAALIAQMIEMENLSEEDMRELQQIAAQKAEKQNGMEGEGPEYDGKRNLAAG